MIYNDRLDSPVGHFYVKNYPKTAENEARLPEYYPETITKSS